jgi:PKD repeat protein
MKRYLRAGWIRGALTSACVALLLMGATGCWLFNVPPTVAFTVSAQTGQAPFTVNFSAALSEDEDGEIVEFKWDFGDGNSGVGETISHTYTEAGTFTVVLRVTDDRGATATTSKNLYVTPAEPPGPSASFTASPTSGTSPLTVNVNASASSYPAGSISQYEWDWGDGATSTGMTASRTYFVTNTTTFTITLTVRATDGKVGTATQTVTVNAAGTTPGPAPAPGAPSARFDILTTDGGAGPAGVAPFRVRLDPSDSKAATGRVLASYVWSFGDERSAFDVNASIQEHTYSTSEASRVFSIMLMVLDNENVSNSITKTVRVINHPPVAGFEIADPWDGHVKPIDAPDLDRVHFPDESAPEADEENRWHTGNITYGNLQVIGGGVRDVTVLIRSRKIDDEDWFDLVGTLDQKELLKATGIRATSTSVPKPDGYKDNAYSYDPEGQTWDEDPPDWFPNRGWGIQYLYVNWGDEQPEERFDYVDDEDTLMYHDYEFSGTALSRTITVRAVDYLGAQSTFSRTVFFRDGYEDADESDDD